MPTILIVDDDEAVRLALQTLLHRKGFEVVSLESGVGVASILRERRIDLVITDIIMPDKEGLETIMEIRQVAPDCKIIAVSGGGRVGPNDYLSAAKMFGANVVFPKPWDNTVLLSTIAKLLALEPETQ
ncbi:MAG: response regulator [Calditrichaeota bacterium]|nr:response regulator [Calditrichota bacterium]MCB9391299.1 response regulator [Calditrichota bacterium]